MLSCKLDLSFLPSVRVSSSLGVLLKGIEPLLVNHKEVTKKELRYQICFLSYPAKVITSDTRS